MLVSMSQKPQNHDSSTPTNPVQNGNLVVPTAAAIVPPIKKSKFGLPGISPMPSKSKDSANFTANTSADRNRLPTSNSKETLAKIDIERPKSKFGLQGLGAVSYTHLTLPTNREV